MYNPKSMKAEEFISHEEILDTLRYAEENKDNLELVDSILEKARECKGLSHREASVLLACEDESRMPGDVSTWPRRSKRSSTATASSCSRRCICPTTASTAASTAPTTSKNKHIPRKKLTQEEVRDEVIALQDMGHKRLAIEAGEDPVNNPIEYILECIETIYSIKHKNGAIRRVNVNIAATTVENYRKLKEAGIGTYILFQETYHKESYEKLHPTGPKHNYAYHTEAMDRAMEGGIDDVGLGVLFGLELYRYEFAGLLMHAEHLEAVHGVGPHTISVPRHQAARTTSTPIDFDNGISDEIFREDLRPHPHRRALHRHDYLHPREPEASASGSCSWASPRSAAVPAPRVGGYAEEERPTDTEQFDVSDQRTLDEVVRWLMEIGLYPLLLHRLLPGGAHRRPVHEPVQERADSELLPSERADDSEGISDGLCL